MNEKRNMCGAAEITKKGYRLKTLQSETIQMQMLQFTNKKKLFHTINYIHIQHVFYFVSFIPALSFFTHFFFFNSVEARNCSLCSYDVFAGVILYVFGVCVCGKCHFKLQPIFLPRTSTIYATYTSPHK